MAKIMIVEDDEKLRSNIESFLSCKGYDVYDDMDFKDVIAYFDKVNPDIVLLDVNLPYDDGFYICSAIRRKSHVPVIFISARSRDVEQIMGIEIGADDYITKPFSLDLLYVKIKSILRRCSKSEAKESSGIKGLILDENSFKLSYKEKSVELSKNEFKLMKKFMDKKDTVVSREELLQELWDDSTFIDDNTLTVNVTRVKNILTSLGINSVIKTKRGAGYIFDTSMMEG